METIKYNLDDCGCYVDGARGIYALDAIVAFAESHGARIEQYDDHAYDTRCDVEDECDEYMNTNFPVEGAYWGRSEQGDWGLWAIEEEIETCRSCGRELGSTSHCDECQTYKN